MKLSRRHFIATTSAFSFVNFGTLASAQTVRVRRNFDTLRETDDDLLALKEGITQMKSRSSTDPLSWETQRRIHANWDWQHGGWRFFPWHRVQLESFEQIIAHLTGHTSFALPYWDWQQSRFVPESFFDTASPLYINGRALNPTVDVSLARWGRQQRFANLALDSFSTFVGSPRSSGRVENLGHNLIHMIVGGAMSSAENATEDPLFFLHHANVDRVWSTWHNNSVRPYPSDFSREAISGFQTPNGPRPIVFAGQILDTVSMGYTYDNPYPFPVFSVTATPPEGKTKREKISARDYFAMAKIEGEPTELSVDLPQEAINAIREDFDQELSIEATGVVRYGLKNLQSRVMKVIASAPEGGREGLPAPEPVVLIASAAFFHTPKPGHENGHEKHHDLGATFAFGDDIINLIGLSKGPITLTSSTIPGRGAETDTKPIATGLEFTLKVTRSKWI